MQYACIAPTAYLDQYAGRGHFQLCLAQVAMRDAAYFEWYKRRREAGDFVILDNGAYEGELVTPEKLIECARELNPNVLTVPDKINDAAESKRMAEDFAQRDQPFQTMRVLQSVSRDLDEWCEEAVYQGGRFSNWVALPRALGDFRPQVAGAVHSMLDHANIHAFGWTGNLNEVRQLAKLGVTSIDTSAPVWRGLACHHLLDEVDEAWETQGSKFDPSYPWSIDPDEHSTIQDNLQAMQRACVAF